MDFGAMQLCFATCSKRSLDLFGRGLSRLDTLFSSLHFHLFGQAPSHFHVAIHAVARDHDDARFHKVTSLEGNRPKFARNHPTLGVGILRTECGLRPRR